MKRVAWGLVAVALLSAACSSGAAKRAPAADSRPNPDVVPAVITPAYVNAVFKVLNHLVGDAARAAVAAHAVNAEVKTYLRAAFNDPFYSAQLAAFRQQLAENLANVPKRLGDRVTTVKKLIYASPSCVFVETRTDYAPIEVHPQPTPASEYWELQLKEPGNDPYHLNPTPWALSYNAAFKVPTTVPDRCAGS